MTNLTEHNKNVRNEEDFLDVSDLITSTYITFIHISDAMTGSKVYLKIVVCLKMSIISKK